MEVHNRVISLRICFIKDILKSSHLSHVHSSVNHSLKPTSTYYRIVIPTMLSLPTTLLFLGSAALTLASPLAPQSRQVDGIPYDLACNDSSTRTVFCANNGVSCDPASSATPDLSHAPIDCQMCTCTIFPPFDDGPEPYVPASTHAVPNAVAPDGEDCHVWNGRVAANPAFAAEHPKVEPCN